MKTGKIILTLLIALSAVVAGYSQEHGGAFGPEKGDKTGDPVKMISIYPNPAIEQLNVRFENPCAKRIKLLLHNLIGNVVDVEFEAIDEHELHIKVINLPAGYYLLSLRDPDTDFKNTYKFVKR